MCVCDKWWWNNGRFHKSTTARYHSAWWLHFLFDFEETNLHPEEISYLFFPNLIKNFIVFFYGNDDSNRNVEVDEDDDGKMADYKNLE